MRQKSTMNIYQKQGIDGASKGKIVLFLLDGTLKFLRIACKSIDNADIEGAHNNIIKAENIIFELMSTLNMDVKEISTNLMKLYDFMVWQLIEANKTKNKQLVEDVMKLVEPLRDAWKEVVEKENKKDTPVIAENFEKASVNIAG